ncbi:ABC transporter substrate-binding protein [Paracoccus pacificus]|uniref:ABC transporter substrate-binding protein n=1 Tax=Paracoccus pacificus TaxID=1463598 RepID=A0ABW4RBP4_9RHOB
MIVSPPISPIRHTALAAAIACGIGGFSGASAQTAEAITVYSWGGTFSAAQVQALNQPFTRETGIAVKMVDADDPAIPLLAQATAGNVTMDVASVGLSDALRLCDEGLIEPLDDLALAPAPDGTPAAQDFMDGTLSDCMVPTDVYSTVLAMDSSRFPGDKPATAADFFDIEKFPGKRGMLKQPRFTLELALLGDGVPADQVYDLMRTPEGVDRAFAKLDTIRDQIIWWDAGAQPVQLLADKEVSLTQAYNGRIFNAVIEDGLPFAIIWDGQIYEFEGWVIPKGAPHPEAAREYVVRTTSAPAQARFSGIISYGPTRKSASALIGMYKDGKNAMAPHLPTAEVNMNNALAFDVGFWADHDAELGERFAAWLASG